MTPTTLSNPTDVEDLSGQTIRGYSLRERIGHGGFGTVYRGYQSSIAREVAIKVIQREFVNNPDFIRVFETEAQLIARLEHIHIVPLYDYWREPDHAVLVMRWLRGGSIHDILSQRGTWELDAVARFLDQIASALSLAHRNNVVHRDIKPGNILFDEEGNAFLTDFGIATTVFENASAGKLVMGTPAYMAPELFFGEPASPQSDIYSLGVVIFELLTGENPLGHKTPEQIVEHHATVSPPNLSPGAQNFTPELNTVLWRATARSPEARYPDVMMLATELRQAVRAGAGQYDHTAGLPVESAPTDPEMQTTIVLKTLWQPDNPFKGLRPFEQSDAADFFGRGALVDQLLTRLGQPGRAGRFLAVVGPSGSGKSSVVKAGLLPALRAGRVTDSAEWFIAEMVPGSQPFKELESVFLSVAVNPITDLSSRLNADKVDLLTALENLLPGDARTELLLVIDQFEEVFTQVEHEAERKRFLDCIGRAVTRPDGRLRVLITLRADFYDRPLLYEDFGTLMRESTEVVLPLSTPELIEAIIGPVERVSMVVEPKLVSTIITEVNEQPGALPLLQYALTEAFERRTGRRLTLDAYTRSGGVTGALARRAEELYSSLDPAHQEVARQLFMHLVSFDEENEVTRRRVSWSTVLTLSEDGQIVQTICDLLIKHRLLTTDRDPSTREPTVEVAHEALLREWKRLKDWLDANQADIQMQRRLHVVAEEWLAAGRDADFLLTGSRLVQFNEWVPTSNLRLTHNEQLFLQTSLAHHAVIQAEEETRRQREKLLERRTRNRLRAIVMVLSVAVAIIAIFAHIAIDQKSEAKEQQTHAEQRLREVQYLSVADHMLSALDDNDSELALALGLTLDYRRADFPILTRQMFYRAAYVPGTRLVFDAHQAPVISVAVSPDGSLAASGSGRINPLEPLGEHGVRVWDTTSGTELFFLDEQAEGHTETVLGLTFSPDGKLLASGSADGTIILWDVATGERIRRIEAHGDWVNRLAFSGDGQMLLSVSGNFLSTVVPIPSAGERDTTVRLWDVATGAEIRRFGDEETGHHEPVTGLALSADGRSVATGDAGGTIILWDFDTGEIIRRFASPGDWVSSLAFSPDGSAIFSALGTPSIGGSGSSSTLMVMWDVSTGERRREFVGHDNVVISVAVSPDGRTVLTGSGDRSMRLWDVETAQELRLFTGHGDWVFGVVFTPDGRRAISGSMDTTVRVWDLVHGAQIQQFETEGMSGIRTVTISGENHVALSGHEDGTIILWNTVTGEEVLRFGAADDGGHSNRVSALAFSPDGKLAVSASLDGSVIVWDVASGTEVRRLEGHTDVVLSVAFSPDGQLIATGSGDPTSNISGEDNSIRLWDVATGTEIARFEGHEDAVWAVNFSADGRQLVSGSGNVMRLGDNSIRIWDVESGAELMRLDGHSDLVGDVFFSPDGTTVVSNSNDNTVRLWSLETRSEIRRFEGHVGYVGHMVFNPDGRTILVGTDDGTIRLWDALTGDEIYRLPGHNDTIQNMALTSDGRQLLAVSQDNDMRLWRIDRTMDELVDWLFANRYLRKLTCPERDTYRIDPPCEPE